MVRGRAGQDDCAQRRRERSADRGLHDRDVGAGQEKQGAPHRHPAHEGRRHQGGLAGSSAQTDRRAGGLTHDESFFLLPNGDTAAEISGRWDKLANGATVIASLMTTQSAAPPRHAHRSLRHHLDPRRQSNPPGRRGTESWSVSRRFLPAPGRATRDPVCPHGLKGQEMVMNGRRDVRGCPGPRSRRRRSPVRGGPGSVTSACAGAWPPADGAS